MGSGRDPARLSGGDEAHRARLQGDLFSVRRERAFPLEHEDREVDAGGVYGDALSGLEAHQQRLQVGAFRQGNGSERFWTTLSGVEDVLERRYLGFFLCYGHPDGIPPPWPVRP